MNIIEKSNILYAETKNCEKNEFNFLSFRTIEMKYKIQMNLFRKLNFQFYLYSSIKQV